MQEFEIKDKESIPLCDLLKSMGFCNSGGHAKTVIAEGLVKVDEKVELRKRCKIKKNQLVEYDGQTIKVI